MCLWACLSLHLHKSWRALTPSLMRSTHPTNKHVNMPKVDERKKCSSLDKGLQTQLIGVKIVSIMGLNRHY